MTLVDPEDQTVMLFGSLVEPNKLTPVASSGRWNSSPSKGLSQTKCHLRGLVRLQISPTTTVGHKKTPDVIPRVLIQTFKLYQLGNLSVNLFILGLFRMTYLVILPLGLRVNQIPTDVCTSWILCYPFTPRLHELQTTV